MRVLRCCVCGGFPFSQDTKVRGHEYKVWCRTQFRGVHTGTLFFGRAIAPTMKTVVGAPEVMSLTFNDAGKCTRVTSDYVVDKTVGNTGGWGGMRGIMFAIGKEPSIIIIYLFIYFFTPPRLRAPRALATCLFFSSCTTSDQLQHVLASNRRLFRPSCAKTCVCVCVCVRRDAPGHREARARALDVGREAVQAVPRVDGLHQHHGYLGAQHRALRQGAGGGERASIPFTLHHKLATCISRHLHTLLWPHLSHHHLRGCPGVYNDM